VKFKIGQALVCHRFNRISDKVVRIQLDALANNDKPYQDAGIEIAFRFASPANKQTTGPLSRFIPLVHNPVYNPMINHQAAQLGELVLDGAKAFLPVTLTALDGKHVGYMFVLSKQEGGAYDYGPHEVMGKSPSILQGSDTDPEVISRLNRDLDEGKLFFGKALNYRKDGSTFMME
jgi:hypothetical protein